MKIFPETLPYLRGEAFSVGLHMRISSSDEPNLDRLSLLEGLAAGKSVIHLGCADHVPLIEEKRSRGQWLHERLCKVSRRCLGIDINAEGIALLEERFSYGDVVCADMLKDEVPQVAAGGWDLLIAGSMIEHVDDPVRFLVALRKACLGNVGSLVMSAPNGMGWVNTRAAMHHQEFVNTDHRYWFTPYTLAKIAAHAGLTPLSFQFCHVYTPPKPGFRGYLHVSPAIDYHMARRYPALREILVMECAF